MHFVPCPDWLWHGPLPGFNGVPNVHIEVCVCVFFNVRVCFT